MSRNEFTRTRDIISNLGDPRAVVREWKDTGGDTVKIEVFYGGRDGGDSDGHGHYVAEKIDGLFQTTLDRHPDIEDGGRHEIEFNRESSRDAYNNEARQDRIQRKQALSEFLDRAHYPRFPIIRGNSQSCRYERLSKKLSRIIIYEKSNCHFKNYQRQRCDLPNYLG